MLPFLLGFCLQAPPLQINLYKSHMQLLVAYSVAHLPEHAELVLQFFRS